MKAQAGFAGQEPVFDKWMATASAEVERKISAEKALQELSTKNLRLADIGSEIVAKSDVELEALAANVTDFASQVAEVRIVRLHESANETSNPPHRNSRAALSAACASIRCPNSRLST